MTDKGWRTQLEKRLIAEGKIEPREQPTAVPLTGKERLQALGRMKSGEKNQTEQRYEDEVLLPGRLTGDILWYRFEGVKLRLADNTFLTVDYAVLPKDGVLTMIDVKGGPGVVTEDARVKMRVAADTYPFVFQMTWPNRRHGWIVEEI
ncbi:hypothetical protein [Sphingobium cupriresistens]|uniref:hypothetical protein n=1 Tax=Sphingobium cupriresistens TaxID=1132417 RepID=UPI003BADD805